MGDSICQGPGRPASDGVTTSCEVSPYHLNFYGVVALSGAFDIYHNVVIVASVFLIHAKSKGGDMNLSCAHWCKIKEFIANLKCPQCFSAKVTLCEEEREDNAACESCGCKFKFNPEMVPPLE
jgi:predicted RNA-binding Zn-ribbon protein involved in translation (DUF1610 family)